MIAMIGSSMVCQSIEYQAGFNAKHVAWGGRFFLAISKYSYCKFKGLLKRALQFIRDVIITK